ncbi:hypothetical protein HHL16_15760 [Pseudoflavitalea sp. G-6-1-2]|uniref:hypothetical protein n=1 Tax=Pseudoflavitalea sp. G-6-1-2 TaxID=2728841 RepID=UPI001469EF4B|nr:hypothetical protein [Pseudoflavitalea sp. G-6-1-2]NML22340.1 hypothetical protein [Pseudoflavitalea sp. G-6-1-2]
MANPQNSEVEVTFINEATGEVMGATKLPLEQLPAAFDKQTTLTISGKKWEIAKADPIYASEFSQTGKLTLRMVSIDHLDPNKIRFSLPTISNELPALTDISLFDDFTLELREDDWRQVEFLPEILLPLIQVELVSVGAVLFPDGKAPELPGYGAIHVREINRSNLALNFEKFCDAAGIKERGAITFAGNTGYVQDGFALRSAQFTFYGTFTNGIIRELCLQNFDEASEGLLKLAAKNELVLIDWCKAKLVSKIN